MSFAEIIGRIKIDVKYKDVLITLFKIDNMDEDHVNPSAILKIQTLLEGLQYFKDMKMNSAMTTAIVNTFTSKIPYYINYVTPEGKTNRIFGFYPSNLTIGELKDYIEEIYGDISTLTASKLSNILDNDLNLTLSDIGLFKSNKTEELRGGL